MLFIAADHFVLTQNHKIHDALVYNVFTKFCQMNPAGQTFLMQVELAAFTGGATLY